MNTFVDLNVSAQNLKILKKRLIVLTEALRGIMNSLIELNQKILLGIRAQGMKRIIKEEVIRDMRNLRLL